MDVDPEILARFVDSIKEHGAEHTKGVAMQKGICATILKVRDKRWRNFPRFADLTLTMYTGDLEVCFNCAKCFIGAHESTESQIGTPAHPSRANNKNATRLWK